jgi:hypothetical protein
VSALGTVARSGCRLASALGTPVAILAAGLPLLAGAAWAALARGVGLARFLDARAVHAWGAALAVAAAVGVLRGAALRQVAYALGCAALLAGCAHVALERAERFEGTVLAGVGEPDPPWRGAASGPRARRPAVEVTDLEDGRLHLRVDGREARLAAGEEAHLGRWRARVVSIAPAPEFEITRPGGAVEGAGLFKLGEDPDAFLEVGALPHRLHLARADGDAADGGTTPARLRLRVFRGKLRVFDGVAAKGEPVAFDGLGFRYADGGAWAEVAVRRVAPWPLGALAAGLAIGATAAAALARRRRA